MGTPSSQSIIVGRGVYHEIHLAAVPAVGDQLNLGGGKFAEGCYRVISVDNLDWDNERHPRIIIERIGDISDGQESLPITQITV